MVNECYLDSFGPSGKFLWVESKRMTFKNCLVPQYANFNGNSTCDIGWFAIKFYTKEGVIDWGTTIVLYSLLEMEFSFHICRTQKVGDPQTNSKDPFGILVE